MRPSVTGATLIVWVAAEAAVGIAIGVCVAIALEAFTFAAQMLGVQAGYGFASTIDPNTRGRFQVLVVLAQLIAGMLFFALGLDREVLRLFALSLEKVPAGAYVFGPAGRGDPDSPWAAICSRWGCGWRCRWSRCW